MYICPNCGKTSEETVAFCSACGSRMVVQQPPVQTPPVYQTPPAYQAPQYQYPAPVYQARVTPAGPHKGKIIAAMAVGIAGFVFAILGVLYTLIFIGLEPATAFAFALVVGGIGMAASMVGMIMSRNNIEEGAKSTMCTVGKNLGLAGVIVAGVALFIGFIALCLL